MNQMDVFAALEMRKTGVFANVYRRFASRTVKRAGIRCEANQFYEPRK